MAIARIPRNKPGRAVAAMLALGLGASLLPAPAMAQDDDRVRRLEAQVRALQRAVFPGGDSRFFEPEVSTAPSQQPAQPVSTPSESAVTDMLGRISAIEAQLARLTAASEVNANALSELSMRVDALEAARQATPLPPSASETGVISVPGSGDSGAGSRSGELPPQSSAVPQDAPSGGPSPQRVAAVEAIAKPATGDRGDDEYVYGFRLWEAGFYPEAQQQLAMTVENYPDHWRTTYARNLLGRAYLDAGDARTAATHFLQNYQADRQAARAPDSLLYLAESMIAMGDTNRACIALAEFGDTFPALATGRLQQQYAGNRNRVDCN